MTINISIESIRFKISIFKFQNNALLMNPYYYVNKLLKIDNITVV